MEIINDLNKEKIAVVVVGFDRLEPLQRLLNSLALAKYPNDDIPLYISIDASHDDELYDYVKAFQWQHGDKYVNIQQERLGLRKHIIQCGDLTRFFKAIVLLEDDVFVSEYFYDYVVEAVKYYHNEKRIGGISLIKSEMGFPGLPMFFMENGSDAFLKKFPASWGECWTRDQWNHFKEWYSGFTDDMFDTIDVPERVKGWKNAWSKYYIAYLVSTNRYFLYPSVSHTTCFNDAGVHSSTINTFAQTNLLIGKKKYDFRPFDEMTKYDVYNVNESVYEWLGYSKEELCIDWYGIHEIRKKYRYLLTTRPLRYKIIKNFGMQMFPIELNIKYGIKGNDIFLYDTISGAIIPRKDILPLPLADYYLRTFNFKLIIRYVISHYKHAIVRRLRLLFN